MSGVAGAERIRSRSDFDAFTASYENLINKFPGFVDLRKSGSYNSDPDKQNFGDIDLIAHIQSSDDKAVTKKKLQAFFHAHPETTIVPFSSVKHSGKRSYNSGEIVTVRYHDDQLGYSVQVDNIIASSNKEAQFKQDFLDMPAEKQGLVLGLVKIAAIETDPVKLFKALGIDVTESAKENQEYEFNLSSVKLELRLVTYEPGTFKQVDRQVLWTSQNWDDLQKLLYQYDLNQSFDELLARSKSVIKNPRSNQRMQGVFASMITVKSGEVGTAKGAGKENALAKVQQTFKESRSLFRSLMETSSPNRIVIAFGRFQPPTIGHELIIKTVKETAERLGCPYAIFVSKKVGTTPKPKLRDPLTIDQKMHFLNKFFPGTNFVAATDTIRTPVEAAKALNQKYNEIVFVAGADRKEIKDLLDQYNHTDYNYNKIDFVSSGERDPDSDGVAGVSGTDVRQAAANNDFDTFKQNLPTTASEEDAMQLMELVRTGMMPTPKVSKKPEPKNKMNPTPEVDEGIGTALAGAALSGLMAHAPNADGAKPTSLAAEPQQVQPRANADVQNTIDQNAMLSQFDLQPFVIKHKESGKAWRYSPQSLFDGGEGIAGPVVNVPRAVLGIKGIGTIPVKLSDQGTFHRVIYEPNPQAGQFTPKESQDGGSYAISKPGYDGESNYPAQPNWRGQNIGEDTSKSIADTANRLANKDDGKVAKLRAAGDNKREQQLKYRDTVRRNDEGVAEGKEELHAQLQSINQKLKLMRGGPVGEPNSMAFVEKRNALLKQKAQILSQLKQGVAEGSKLDTAEKLKRSLKKNGFDMDAADKRNKEAEDWLNQWIKDNPEYAPKKEVPLSEDVDMLMASAMLKLIERHLK